VRTAHDGASTPQTARTSSLPRGCTCAIMYVACLFFSPVVGGCGRVVKTAGWVFRRAGTA